jgi:hypothetical protein
MSEISLDSIDENGTIKNENGKTVLYIKNGRFDPEFEQVECLNSEAETALRVYRAIIGLEGVIVGKANGEYVVYVLGSSPDCIKYGAAWLNKDETDAKKKLYTKTFCKKKIYLSDRLNEIIAMTEEKSVFPVSMNGYSSISKEWMEKYGVKDKAYEKIAGQVLHRMITAMKEEMPSARFILLNGDSDDMGIDMVIRNAADLHNITLIGVSCPKYMLYSRDDDKIVHVACTKKLYSDRFIRLIRLLVCMGGRQQSLVADIAAACEYRTRMHIVDIINEISERPIPSTIIVNGKEVIENAARAFLEKITVFGAPNSLIKYPNRSRFENLTEEVNSIAIDTCRLRMEPEHMFRNNF